MLRPVFLKNLQLSDINPRICGVHICEPGDVFPWHYIERHVLHYVTNGCGTYLVNGREYAVSAGDLFISHSGYHTSYIADREDPFTYVWVSFECGEPFSDLLHRDVMAAPWAAPIFAGIAECSGSSSPEWTVCARLYDFFAQLSDHQEPQAVHKEDYVSRAINYIQSNYAETIHVDDMATVLGLSRSYFSRLFRQQTGLSPQAYLVAFRLERAAVLLTRHGLSQKETAAQVGYPDVCAFSRMFKRKFGVSPGVYVREHSL